MSEPYSICPNGETCQLAPQLDALKQEVNQLAELVKTDVLTGLHNYRYFKESIHQEIERSQRTGLPTTLIMLDADHFKRVNDNWGHEIGNQALKLIADCIRNNVRKLDIACRYGGEEFAIILPSSDIGIAKQVAERVREAVEQTELVAGSPEERVPLTISLGISSYPGHLRDTWNQLVERTDAELYRAKQSGRNCICYSSDAPEQQVSDDEKSALFDIFK